MIVKNEAHVIRRCLESVKPLISTWLIVDTGSTDDTQAVIADALAGIPGKCVERPWVNFGANRSEALALARSQADYSLMMDADDYLETDAQSLPASLTAHAYHLRIRDGAMTHSRLQLFNNALPWRYEGVLHEYPVCEQATRYEVCPGIIYVRCHDGSRWSDPAKFRKDAEILEAALKTDPTNARYVFYLAQSYRDAGMPGEAITSYQRRAEMGGWEEEVFQSLLEIGRLQEGLAPDPAVVWSAYLRAFQFNPKRAEPLCYLARYCRLQGQQALALVFATQAIQISQPADGLFIDEQVYQWLAADEYALAAHFSGKHSDAIQITHRLLTDSRLPATERDRVRANQIHYLNAFTHPYQIQATDPPRPRPEPLTQPPYQIASDPIRVAVITPYHQEPMAYLEQCHASVKAQVFESRSVIVEQFMVADGHSRPELDSWQIQHLKLPHAHDDAGDTPRTLGAFTAINQGFDAIAFLDADNWYHPDHLQSLLQTQQQTGSVVCTTARTLHRLDGSVLPFVEPYDGQIHVDTSCYLFCRPAFKLATAWGQIPQPLAPICDRVIWRGIRMLGLSHAFTGKSTVAFRTLYQSHYLAAGEPAPAAAKASVSLDRILEWWRSQPELSRQQYCEGLGFSPL